MADDIVVTPRVIIPGAELAFAFSRSGGPGGQNVNKVASKVELRWNPMTSSVLGALGDDERAWLIDRLRGRLTTDGTLIVTSTATRDQLKNRDDATSKLALIVRVALVRPKPRKPTKVSRGAKRRRVADKRHHAEIKRHRGGGGGDD
jgi:ribosome-associated protein